MDEEKDPTKQVEPASTPGETPGSATKRSEPEPEPEPIQGEMPEEEFDKDRAMATIHKLRDYERKAKALQKQLEELKAESADAATLQEQLDAVAVEAATFEMKAAAIAKAADADFAHPADAWQLMDTSKLTLKEDGTVEGLDEQLEELKKSGRLPLRGTSPVANPAGESASEPDYFAGPRPPGDAFWGGS